MDAAKAYDDVMAPFRRREKLRAESICEKCETRPATMNWSEGGMDFARGYYSRWCERCVLETQVERGEQIASQLPTWRRRLAEVIAEEPSRG